MQLNTRGFPSVKIYPLVKRLVSSDVCQKHLQPRINFHNELDWKNNIHNKILFWGVQTNYIHYLLCWFFPDRPGNQ